MHLTYEETIAGKRVIIGACWDWIVSEGMRFSHLKTVSGVTRSGVRIPLPPPKLKDLQTCGSPKPPSNVCSRSIPFTPLIFPA